MVENLKVYFKREDIPNYCIHIFVNTCCSNDLNYEMYDIDNKCDYHKFGYLYSDHSYFEDLQKQIDEEDENEEDEAIYEPINPEAYDCVVHHTGIREETFRFELEFDTLKEMVNFIEYYGNFDINYNILEDYYHFIFVDKKDYQSYLQTKYWKSISKSLKDKKGQCQLCKSRYQLAAHHNNYSNLCRETEEDLIVLCKKCHTWNHKKR